VAGSEPCDSQLIYASTLEALLYSQVECHRLLVREVMSQVLLTTTLSSKILRQYDTYAVCYDRAGFI